MRTETGSGFLQYATKSVTFTGASGLGAAGSTTTLFTVTGQVLMALLVPFCTDGLTEAAPTATISLGVAGSTALFIAATNSVDIDTNEYWVDSTPDPNGVSVPVGLKDFAINGNVVAACAAQNTNGGTIRFDFYWMPLSPGATVVAA